MTNNNGNHDDDPRAWLTVAQLAAHLGVQRGTVYNWRHEGTGPASVRLGGRPRYRLTDVNAWLAATAAEGGAR